LSLNKRERISLPIAFGEKKKKEKIEGAFEGGRSFTTVEMVKRNTEWYAHFVLKKTVELPDEPETVIVIDRGEHTLATAVAISRSNPDKPMKGQWHGEEIERLRGLYGHIRRKLQEKHSFGEIKIKHSERERRSVN